MLHTFQGTLYHFVKKSKKSFQPSNLTKTHTNKHPQTTRKPHTTHHTKSHTKTNKHPQTIRKPSANHPQTTHHTQITHKPSVNHIQTTHKKIPRKIHTFQGTLHHFVKKSKIRKSPPDPQSRQKNTLGRSEPSKGIPY